MAAPFSVSKESEKYVVIANQCRNTGVALSKDSLRSQSVTQSLPLGEGARGTRADEGKGSPC